ncbi:MAG: SDR family NAD(P)-dependent oxidoreductase [Alphaproteobacteria bacterium]
MERLEGKVCVVTGGSLGIGAATCERLAAEGGKVAITDILEEEGMRLRDHIAQSGGEAAFWRLDVTDEANVRQVFGDIHGRWGRFDVLVNNAGIAGADKPTHEIEAEEWDRVMAVNVSGVFYCTKHAVPLMLRNSGGSIVNLSSIYGIIGAPDIPPYHASKGAVREMTKTDALLYAGDRIRVNSVHPGFIWTPLVQKMAEESPQGLEGFREEVSARHPLGHVGESEDIAAGIAYLASDDAKFVTGSELVIDGGYISQ